MFSYFYLHNDSPIKKADDNHTELTVLYKRLLCRNKTLEAKT